ncbi:MAG: MFS transporter [Clostridiales bacterium]|nr:MFS transporter [Clostridiales bacterium]
MKQFFSRLLRRNRLLGTLLDLRGNARYCLILEPLWGVPNTLYVPLVSKYMEALGLSPLEIGAVITVNLLSQMGAAAFGGAWTDRLGRRRTTFLFDLVAWSLPCLLWTFAQGFAWFLAAALLNGLWRVTETSWSLLMVEDAPQDKLVSIYALATVAGLLSGFVSPLTSVLIGRFSLVSTMRGLYLFSFVSMTTKAFLLHKLTRETSLGQKRLQALHGKPWQTAMQGTGRVLREMFHNRPLMLTLGIISCVLAIRSAMENFWPLLVTGPLRVGEEQLPLLAALKNLVMLASFLLLSHRLRAERFRRPMAIALGLMAGLSAMLLVLPARLNWALVPGVVAEALALSILIPLYSSLQMLLLDQQERARMMGLSLAFCLLVTAPFGTINGMLSRWHAALPMAVCLALSVLALALLNRLGKSLKPERLRGEA